MQIKNINNVFFLDNNTLRHAKPINFETTWDGSRVLSSNENLCFINKKLIEIRKFLLRNAE